MHLFPSTSKITCFSPSRGHSVLNYALVHVNGLPIIKNFKIGSKWPYSDHLPLWLTLGVHIETHKQKIATTLGDFQVDLDKEKEYATTLDAKLNAIPMIPT